MLPQINWLPAGKTSVFLLVLLFRCVKSHPVAALACAKSRQTSGEKSVRMYIYFFRAFSEVRSCSGAYTTGPTGPMGPHLEKAVKLESQL